jgi:hypothetical protein
MEFINWTVLNYTFISMNELIRFFSIFLLPLLFFFSVSCERGELSETDDVVEHRKSPIVISSFSHADTYIKIVYGQPYKRGRDIFGGLEPYGEVWRTGANEATEITVTNDIFMDGNRIEAGTYSLFSIPGEDEWTIILNNQLGQWGAFNYDEADDYLRFQRPVIETEEVIEALMITFEETENFDSLLVISWDDTRIEIPIEII